MIDWVQARRNMVDGQIRTRDVTDRRVIDAFLAVPRERFVPSDRRALAYVDDCIPVAEPGPDGAARYLMEPMTLARLIQLAELEPDDLVLDVGSATGYSTAIIARLAGSVVALEEDPELARRAQAVLADIEVDNVAVVEEPLIGGYPSEAPYDAIVLEGAVEEVPQALLDQLAEGGRLVAVVTSGGVGRARRYLRCGDRFGVQTEFDAALRPLSGFQRKPSFVF